ncbi:MAG: hypothetical protein AAGA23_21685 [Pseudomonadota bacterium]
MSPMTKAGTVTAALTLFSLTSPATAAIIADRPDAIVCSVKDPTGVLPWDELVFYVSAHTRKGRTLYKTLTSDPVVLFVDAQNVVQGDNLANCDGRTVDALRKEGRAVDLSRGTPGLKAG